MLNCALQYYIIAIQAHLTYFFDNILEIRRSKLGRAGNVFKMREVIARPKNHGQEAIALIDSRTGEVVVSNSGIKRVANEYCADLFNNNMPVEGFEEQ